jgi:hypothetical protein
LPEMQDRAPGSLTALMVTALLPRHHIAVNNAPRQISFEACGDPATSPVAGERRPLSGVRSQLSPSIVPRSVA